MKLTMLRAALAGHPGAQALEHYAVGDPTSATEEARAERARAERARVATHLVRCAECREAVTFRRALHAGVRQLPEGDAPDRLLDRVIAERQQGNRIILPSAWPEPREPGNGRLVGALVAASILIAAWAGWRARTTRADAFDDWFARGGLIVGSAVAQMPAPEASRLAPAALDGDRLRPATLVYATQWIGGDGRVRFDGRMTVRIDSLRFRAEGAHTFTRGWYVVRHWASQVSTGTPRVEQETLVLGHEDLHPIRRDVTVTPYDDGHQWLSIRQTFDGDRMRGEMKAGGTDGHDVWRPIDRTLPSAGRPYLTDAVAPVVLAAVADLEPGWARRASVAGWGVKPNDLSYEVTLRVVGEEQVTTAAGTFDSWRLSVVGGGRVLDYWVRKRDGIAVRSRDASPQTDAEGKPRGVREIVLVKE